MTKFSKDPAAYALAIKGQGISIYDPIAIGDPDLWIPSPELEALLDAGMRGVSFAGLPLRTRSKVVKELACKLLGYPVPKSFKKCQPRFLGQMIDIYTQKSNNLQVWNEELSATRRYVLIRIDEDSVVTRVKVVTGDTLAILDTTGTLTQKYQARCTVGTDSTEQISQTDTSRLASFLSPDATLDDTVSPTFAPQQGSMLAIGDIFQRLAPLVGQTFTDAGADQERNRGAALHRLVCKALGYSSYQDDGQFPDVRNQVLEVKLQTSPTIDLGLVTPASVEPLDVPMLSGTQIRHCDVRYAIFYAKITGGVVTLTHLFMVTGQDFFSRFPQFQGKVLNSKLQIPLPSSFFND